VTEGREREQRWVEHMVDCIISSCSIDSNFFDLFAQIITSEIQTVKKSNMVYKELADDVKNHVKFIIKQ
jgi:hypothetical protein